MHTTVPYDTAYSQLGGPDASWRDVTSRVSYLVLAAGHRLKIPANVGVSVGKNVDPGLLKRGVEIMFEDRTAFPKFLGVDETTAGYARDGYPVELGRERAYAGCHWIAIPGREYCINDCIKVNLARVFEIALDELMADSSIQPSIANLWERYDRHMRRAVDVMYQHLDFHMAHMHEVFPELVMDLLRTAERVRRSSPRRSARTDGFWATSAWRPGAPPAPRAGARIRI